MTAYWVKCGHDFIVTRIEYQRETDCYFMQPKVTKDIVGKRYYVPNRIHHSEVFKSLSAALDDVKKWLKEKISQEETELQRRRSQMALVITLIENEKENAL